MNNPDIDISDYAGTLTSGALYVSWLCKRLTMERRNIRSKRECKRTGRVARSPLSGECEGVFIDDALLA